MAMRITGMNSGLDTESLIQDLVKARRMKVDKQTKAQTKLQWKQEAWVDLNKKLKNLQSKYLNNMRFSDAYAKKATKVSNSSVASVITGENAVLGVQTLKVDKMAKTGYLTGGALEGKDGKLTALSKLSDIKGFTGSETGKIQIKAGEKTIDMDVNGDTTISNMLTQLKNVGLNANFDEKNQRFFVSSQTSGASSDFSITASDEAGMKALAGFGLLASTVDKATAEEYKKYAAFKGANDTETSSNMEKIIEAEVDSRTNSYLEQYKKLVASSKAAQDQINTIDKKYKDKGETLDTAENYRTQIEAKQAEIDAAKEALKTISDDDKEAKEAEIKALEEERKALTEKRSDAELRVASQKTIDDNDTQKSSIEEYVAIANDGEENPSSAVAKDNLIKEVTDKYVAKANYAATMVDGEGNVKLPADINGTATKVDGQDAEITLNGAKFKNSNNTFEINGLTITALAETKEGEEVTITTEQDTDGIYDMVKNFLKEYNELVNEMDKLYNAAANSKYEPLTDEEKDAVSEAEAKKIEEKVRESLLRRDENLGTVNNALQTIMSAGVTVGGKKMYLSDFGIDTLDYFSAPADERHAYHIDGDADDSNTSGKPDKLKSMIANDVDTVISFFTNLSRELYSRMTDLSKSVEGSRSYGNFYDDKKLQSDYESYTSRIASMEEDINKYEDKWYSKFSKMETALAKMQSNASSLGNLFGS